MSSVQQTSRLYALSNNNIQRKQLKTQGILPQSLSGSDTDISSSNENLSTEERYVIRHTARQEPQGQENQQSNPSRSSSHKENIPNIQGSLIHRNSLKDNLNGSNRNSLKENLNGSNRNSLKDSINGSNRNSLKDNLSNRTSVGSNRSSLDISTSSYNTLIIHNANDENAWSTTARLSNIVREHNDVGYLYCENNSGKEYTSPKQSLTSLSNDEKFYGQSNNSGCQEITDIPDDYLSQSQVLKHLAKEVKPTYSKLPTSCETSLEIKMRGNDGGKRNSNTFTDQPFSSYPTLLSMKNKRCPLRRTEKFTFSRSQPNLSEIGTFNTEGSNSPVMSPRPHTKGCEEIETTFGEIWPASEMFQFAIQENSNLKLELERCYNKVAKSQKLEQEILKVHRAHEELAASCERREKLERAARLKLQNDCRRLTELNRALRDQIDLLSSRSDNPPIVDSMRKELTQRELLIGQLITQNKELVAAKERQEIELAAQRATLQEQRTHIDILDTALTNAQGNVVRLEEESRKKQIYVERVGQLQRALSSLQASSDRREETERQLRGQLERELREGDSGSCANEQSFNGETIAELKRRVRERDERIMSLEGDVAKWEQRYLEESALRQAAIEAASLPKDAKIAALEKTSQDAEKMIAEARSDKIRHMDEVHVAQKKLADLESRMKDLESKLAEKDAMIRVLQKHTYDKESSSNGVGSYPPAHSTHSTTTADLTSTSKLVARISSVSSVLDGVRSYGSAGSYGASYKYRKQGSFEQTNKSLDDQLKALDSQLLSKRALCCFPGFSNPGIASRKGKISKPLLAGVDSTGCSSTASSKSPLLNDSSIDQSGIIEFATVSAKFRDAVSRLSDGKPEDMLLLEKQGRSSQQQRMQESEQRRAGSLPPSSLPRPPRSLKSISGSRYCRLSHTETRKKSDPGPVIDTSIKITPGTLEYGRYNMKGQQTKKTDVDFLKSSVKKQSCSEYERFGEIERKKQGIIMNVEHRETQDRSFIPPPRRIGEYGRLSDGDAKTTFRKQAVVSRGMSTSSTVSSKSEGRDSGGTASSEVSILPLPPSKLRSMSRPNYHIQF